MSTTGQALVRYSWNWIELLQGDNMLDNTQNRAIEGEADLVVLIQDA